MILAPAPATPPATRRTLAAAIARPSQSGTPYAMIDGTAPGLERYASRPGPRIVPVVLGGLLNAPWSFTAQPAPLPAGLPTAGPRDFEPGLAAEVHH